MLLINISPMINFDNRDGDNFILDGVKNAVAALPDAVLGVSD
jgi:hypothetical protein